MLDIVAGGHKQGMLIFIYNCIYILHILCLYQYMLNNRFTYFSLYNTYDKNRHDLSVGCFVPEVHVPKVACCICFLAFLVET